MYEKHMKTEIIRLCIYPKDIQRITGKSYRQSLRISQAIKISLGKQSQEFISVEEFCSYAGLNIDQVRPLLLG